MPAGCPHQFSVTAGWGDLLFPYTKNGQIFRCPSSTRLIEVRPPSVHTVLLDNCPPPPSSGDGSGGGNVIGGVGGGPPPCPAPKLEWPVKSYSYGLNALTDDDLWWEHSQGVGAGRSGFDRSKTSITCVVKRGEEPVSEVAVVSPSTTIYLSDSAPWNERSDVQAPSFVIDAQLPYANKGEGFIDTSQGRIQADELPERVSDRHSNGFNALFADGHVKHRPFSATQPKEWTIQDD